MTGPFSTATIIVGLLLAVWALVYLVMNKRVDRYLQIATLGLAVMFVVLAVGGIVQMMGTDKELARAEFVGYLLLSPLIPVGGWWWAKNDETRWGAGVLLVVGREMRQLRDERDVSAVQDGHAGGIGRRDVKAQRRACD